MYLDISTGQVERTHTPEWNKKRRSQHLTNISNARRIVCVFFLEDYVVMMDIRARWWYCCCCYGDLEESSSFRPRRLAHSAWLSFFFYGRLKRRMKQWNAQLSRLFRRSLFHHRIPCYSLIQRIINVFSANWKFHDYVVAFLKNSL